MGRAGRTLPIEGTHVLLWSRPEEKTQEEQKERESGFRDIFLPVKQEFFTSFFEGANILFPLRDDFFLRMLVQNRIFGGRVAKQGVQLFGLPLVRVEFP